eukprot:5381394-Alexandrium_andersonii.AAC.1
MCIRDRQNTGVYHACFALAAICSPKQSSVARAMGETHSARAKLIAVRGVRRGHVRTDLCVRTCVR